MKLREAFDKFLKAKDGEVKATTLEWYTKYLRTLLDQLGDREIDSITVDDLREWRYDVFHRQSRYVEHPVRSEIEGGYSEASCRGHIRALKGFFSWLYQDGKIPNNPAASIKPPPKPRRVPKYISDEDLVKLLEAARDNPRDYALVQVLADTGARVGGIATLTVNNVYLDRLTLVVTEKGEKSREVYLTEESAQALADWLTLRPDDTDLVFASRMRERGLTGSGIYRVLRRLARKAGVEGHFNPHSFRHGFAHALINNGASLEVVSELMGHSNVGVTAESYLVWTKQELQEKHQRFSRIRNLHDQTPDE